MSGRNNETSIAYPHHHFLLIGCVCVCVCVWGGEILQLSKGLGESVVIMALNVFAGDHWTVDSFIVTYFQCQCLFYFFLTLNSSS